MRTLRLQSGATMMEVLVSILIVVIGLLGLAGLQARINLSEMESFQRAQALVLLQDMVDRISANRKNAANYVTVDPLGTGNNLGACYGLFDDVLDKCQWNNSLLGAAEEANSQKVGGMIGARGCVAQITATPPAQYTVSVVWQGINPTIAPRDPCGQGRYGNDATRRVVSANIIIGCLQNNPVTGACMTKPASPPLR